MALRTCDPTSGSIGKQTYAVSRLRQIVRTRAIPANPNTNAQKLARANFTTASKAWDQLTDAQRAAWRAAAADVMSKSRLGQKASLTGNQYFLLVNANLAALSEDQVTAPPATPSFADLPITALVITNAANVATLKLTTTDNPPDHCELWAAAPTKAGVGRTPSMVLLNALDTPTSNAIDITAVYKARFGNPAVAQRVFVGVKQINLGIAGPMLTFNATMPASA